ncbi:MAG: hypothetical protein K0R28_2184, partial [Paenibacillus sp.]|nr:hypothetical protein [Paenibacillus sp.]
AGKDRLVLAAIRARTFARLGLSGSEPGAGDSGLCDAASQQPAYPELIGAETASADAAELQETNGAIPANRRRFVPGRRALRAAIAAVLLAVVLTSAYSASSSEVRAQVRKWLQFLPGFAVVQISEDNTVRFVLAEPVAQSWKGGAVELRGVSIGDSYSSISITGSAGQDARSVTLTNADGIRYTFQYGTVVRSEGWLGQYYYKGTVRATTEMEASFDNGASPIKFRLQPAVNAGKIEDLGATSDRSGVRMTAVTVSTEANRRRVTLIPQLQTGIRLTSYGLSDFDQMEMPLLTTAAGEQVELRQDPTFPNPNEFSFSPGPDAAEGYRLVVPAVKAVKHADTPVKVTFPVPKEGILTLDKRIDLLGYPVDIVRVERIPNHIGTGADSVRIYWNLHYDAAAAESPLLFFPDFGYTRQSGGASAKSDEETHVMQYMELEVAPGEKEHTIYVSDLTLLIRGPWTFDLKE